MQHIRLAVASRVFQAPLKETIHAAATIGAEALQFDARTELRTNDLSDTGIRQLLHRLSEHHLGLSSLSFSLRRPLATRERLDDRLAAIRGAMELTHRLKARILTLHTGSIPTDATSDEYGILVGILNDLAQYGNHVGASLCLTTGTDNAEDLLQLVKSVEHGPLGVDFDPAAFVVSGSSVNEAFRTLYAQIQHIRIRDAARNVDGFPAEVAVGTGEVVWDEFLALSDEAAYKGWMTVDRTTGDNPAVDAAQAIQYLRNIAPT